MAGPDRPHFAIRLALLAAFAAFAGLDHNPLVRFQAWVGLSPSPLERFFGLRGPFSGMTEATYRLVHLDLPASLQANVLTIPFLAAASWCLLAWKAPRMRSRRDEYVAFAILLAAIAINNLAPAWLGAA